MIGKELKAHAIKWLGSLNRLVSRKQPMPMVDDATARARALTCQRCPHMHQVGGGCSTCKRAVLTLRAAVLGQRQPPDLKIGACAILGVDCLTASVLDEPKIGAENLPDWCWRK